MGEAGGKVQNSLIRMDNNELTLRAASLVRRGLQEISQKEFRTITFPEDCEIGVLFVAKTPKISWRWAEEWQLIGKAAGKIVVPNDKSLILRAGHCVERYPLVDDLSYHYYEIRYGYNDRMIIDLSALSQLNPEDLQGLDVSVSSFDNILPIVGLTQLQYLDASETYLCSLAPIESLSKLRVLNLSNTEIVDTEYLQSLTQLVELDLSNTSIYEISYLKDLHQLKWLNLSDTPYCNKEIAALKEALPNCDILY